MEIKEGQISILSTDGKSWKKRYCSLKNRILYVYENKNKSDTTSTNYKILHFIPLARCGVITTALKGPNGKPHCFKITHQMDDSIQYWMSNDSEDEMKEWVGQLQGCCAIQKEPEVVETFRGRSKSVAFKPGALQLAGISDHSGWLKKQAATGLRKGQWKKRWFVLKDMILYYYEGPDSKLKGKISIPNWKIEIDNSIPSNYCFKLSHTGYPNLLLMAETEEERDKWINNIKESDKYLTQPVESTTKLSNISHQHLRLSQWLSTITTLDIQEPCQFLYNLSFVINLLEKLGIKILIEDKPESKEKEREWSLKSFDTILKTLQSNNIKIDSNLTSHDFINMNQVPVLEFAYSIHDHFNTPIKKDPSFTEQLSEKSNSMSNVSVSAATATVASTTDHSSVQTTPQSTSPQQESLQSIALPTSTSNTSIHNSQNNDEISSASTVANILENNAEDVALVLSEQPLINELLNGDEFAILQVHSTPNTPVKPLTNPKHPLNKFVSPHRNLKRVDTNDVIGEFDKMFSSFATNLKKCGHCNEPITGESINAINKVFHPHHLLCNCCNKHLIDLLDVPYVERSDKLYCKECHDKSFNESNCSKCNKSLMITYAYKGQILCNEHYACVANLCQKCEKPITTDQVSHSIETKQWHAQCFKCNYCQTSLNNEWVVKNGMPYCQKCNTKLF